MKKKNRTQKRWRYLKALWRRKGKRDKQVHPDWSPKPSSPESYEDFVKRNKLDTIDPPIDPMAGLDLDCWDDSLPYDTSPKRIEKESPSMEYPLPEWMTMIVAMNKTIADHPELFNEGADNEDSC